MKFFASLLLLVSMSSYAQIEGVPYEEKSYECTYLKEGVWYIDGQPDRMNLVDKSITVEQIWTLSEKTKKVPWLTKGSSHFEGRDPDEYLNRGVQYIESKPFPGGVFDSIISIDKKDDGEVYSLYENRWETISESPNQKVEKLVYHKIRGRIYKGNLRLRTTTKISDTVSEVLTLFTDMRPFNSESFKTDYIEEKCIVTLNPMNT